MSSQERYLQEMAAHSTMNNVPSYNPTRQIPPDLLARTTGHGTSSEAAQQYAQTEGTINQRAQPEYYRALRRQGYFVTQPFTVGEDPLIIRPMESRTYFFIQNLSASSDLYVGFGSIPNGKYGLTLVSGAAYEPFTVPTNEIYIAAQTGIVTGFIIYSREAD